MAIPPKSPARQGRDAERTLINGLVVVYYFLLFQTKILSMYFFTHSFCDGRVVTTTPGRQQDSEDVNFTPPIFLLGFSVESAPRHYVEDLIALNSRRRSIGLAQAFES